MIAASECPAITDVSIAAACTGIPRVGRVWRWLSLLKSVEIMAEIKNKVRDIKNTRRI